MATNAVSVKRERTEEEILAQAPIKIALGNETYDVKPLRIKAARKWRSEVIGTVKEVAAQMQVPAENTPIFLNGLGFLFLQFPEKLADLFFAYAKDLNREEIEGDGEKGATEEQLACGFGQIMQVAFPFVKELQAMNSTIHLAGSIPPSARPSNLQ
jgi:hypothetical protein